MSMDKVKEEYERVKDKVSLDEFLALVEENEKLMGGLSDRATAAMLVAQKLGGYDEHIKIEQINADIPKVTVVGKIIACSDVRNFDREDGSVGSVANLTLADETGSIKVVLWDQAADLVKVGEIVFGDTVQVSGMVREGRTGLEISVGRGGSVDKMAVSEEIKVRIEPYRVEEIRSGMGSLHMIGKILDISDTRTFQRKDGNEGRVRNITIGDATGKIRVTLWDKKVDEVDQFRVGDTIEFTGGYARENTFNNQVEVNLGNDSSIWKSSKPVEFKEKLTPIADIQVNESYSIQGKVTGLDELKEFSRQDGSTGRVVNIYISDDTGRIRAALWGDQTELLSEIDFGTELLITDCYAKPGWNDEVELSVGERSTIKILDK